jgi:hypothetical protein
MALRFLKLTRRIMKKLFIAIFVAAVAIQVHGAELSPEAKSLPQSQSAQANGAAPVTEKNESAPISCFKAADTLHNTEWSTKNLTTANKIRLCSGAAAAEAPIDCFKKAGALEWGGKTLTVENRIRLCGGAGSAEAPLSCFRAAEKLTTTEWGSTALTLGDRIELCGGAVSGDEPVSCFKAAGKLTTTESGGKALTADNKIKLCGKKLRL